MPEHEVLSFLFIVCHCVVGRGGGGVGNRKPHSIAKLSPFFILSMERGVGRRVASLSLFFPTQADFFLLYIKTAL
jgi:hypothetical protein